MAFPVAAAITAGAGLVQSGLSMAGQSAQNRATRLNNDNNRLYDSLMMRLQEDLYQKHWNQTNEYNTPAAQVKRMREAGLNPALMYGGSPVNTAGSIGVPSAGGYHSQSERHDYAAIGAPLGAAAVNAVQLELQKKSVDADVALKASAAAKNAADTNLKDIDSKTREAMNNYKAQALNWSAEKMYYASQNEEARGDLMEAQRQKILTDTDISKMMAEPNKQKVLADIAYKAAQTLNSGVARNLMLKRIESGQIDNDIRSIELNLLKKGVTKDSPWWYKGMAQGMENVANGIAEQVSDSSGANLIKQIGSYKWHNR